MKTFSRIVLAAAVSACLSSCAAFDPAGVPTRQVSRDYSIAPSDVSGVTAFVYGPRTVLEFKVVPAMLFVKDAQGSEVGFEREGRFVRLDRVVTAFTVWMNGQRAYFESVGPARAAAIKTAPAAPAAPATAAIASDTVALKAEPIPVPKQAEMAEAISKMQQQLAEIRASLAHAKNGASTKTELQKLNARLDQIESQLNSSVAVLQVTFPKNGTEFKPSSDVAEALLAAAKVAQQINVRGRTDSRVAGLDDPVIALNRALSARKFLMDNGVSGDKIRVYSLSQGDFVAPNWTEAGKAKNRRVEIELVKNRAVPVTVASNSL